MTRKIPPDAFDHYFSLGIARSYRAVAAKYGVSKQSITKCAGRERWQERLAAIEEKARHSSTEQSLETLERMTQRHLQTLKVIQGKALQALKSMPLATAMEAVRALDMTIGKERLIRGEPSDRTAVSIEETIRKEYDRWLVVDGDETGGGNGAASDQ